MMGGLDSSRAPVPLFAALALSSEDVARAVDSDGGALADAEERARVQLVPLGPPRSLRRWET